MNFLVSWKSLTTTALTRLPSKGPKPQPPRTSVTSRTVRSIRRSGLSEPYFSMASVKGIRRKGAELARSYLPYLAKMGGSTSSSTANTSSWEAKAISISS